MTAAACAHEGFYMGRCMGCGIVDGRSHDEIAALRFNPRLTLDDAATSERERLARLICNTMEPYEGEPPYDIGLADAILAAGYARTN